MTIKPDEIELVQLILKYCKKDHDMIPTEEIFKMDINHKRLEYLINKLTWFINYGVSPYYGWLDIPPWEIKIIYKNKYGVDLNDN